jgi:hypothetical protein
MLRASGQQQSTALTSEDTFVLLRVLHVSPFLRDMGTEAQSQDDTFVLLLSPVATSEWG